jgi:hypothetical protein
MQSDKHVDAQCSRTAEAMTKLMGLRGISGQCEWRNGQYWANGAPCGQSIHGVYDWLNKQPGVKA